MLVMKRIPTQENGFWKRVFINIPFILLVALMIAFFGGGLLLVFYSIVSVVAFNSAMIYLIVAGAGCILIGLGLLLITAYKKYFEFYNKKMGWKYVEDESKPQRTVTYANKTALQTVKKYLTVANVGLGILALGSLFAIISAGLGCIDRENWVEAIGGFREERGYYTDIRNESVSFSDSSVTEIQIVQSASDDRRKEIIVIYTNLSARQGRVEVAGYKKFDGDFNVSFKDPTVTVSVGEAPKRTQPLERLLFFVFDDYVAEKQINVYIPYSRYGEVTVSQTNRVLFEKSDGTVESALPEIPEPDENDR